VGAEHVIVKIRRSGWFKTSRRGGGRLVQHPVHRSKTGEDGSLYHIGAHSPAPIDAMAVADLHKDFAQGVTVLGHRLQAVILQAEGMPDDLLHRPQGCIDRTCAAGHFLEFLLSLAQCHAGSAGHHVAAVHHEAVQFPDDRRALACILHQGDDVAIGDGFLSVGKILEFSEETLRLFLAQGVAEVGKTLLKRVLTAVLAEHQAGVHHPYALGCHDLIGEAVGHHAVLVDAALMGEGVCTDDCFGGIGFYTGYLGEQT